MANGFCLPFSGIPFSGIPLNGKQIPLAIILPNTVERSLTDIPFRIPFNGILFNGIPLAIILPNTIERPLIGIPFRIPFNGIQLNE